MLLTGPAGRTRPQHVIGDHITEHAHPIRGFFRTCQYGGGGVHMPLQVKDDNLGRQGFATEPPGIILTAPTTCTRIQIEELFPRQNPPASQHQMHARHRLFIAFQGLVEIS